jgi:hypothetical protein
MPHKLQANKQTIFREASMKKKRNRIMKPNIIRGKIHHEEPV